MNAPIDFDFMGRLPVREHLRPAPESHPDYEGMVLLFFRATDDGQWDLHPFEPIDVDALIEWACWGEC